MDDTKNNTKNDTQDKTQDKTQLSLSNQHPNDESRCLDWKVNRTENEKYELNFKTLVVMLADGIRHFQLQ